MRYWTAGESHGKGILAFLEGFPAGFAVDTESIDAELRRRQGGYGRGARQSIETDQVEFLSGIWKGTTTGAPIGLWVKNRDYKIDEMPEIEFPRPGHADLSGAIKYRSPIRPILERASARETAGRVAAGALAQGLLNHFKIRVFGYVVSLGSLDLSPEKFGVPDAMRAARDRSEVYSLVPQRDDEAKALIDRFAGAGDTLGGVVEVRVFGVPIGLGTHAQWDEKLDGRLARAVMSVQSVKGVEIGLGFESAHRPGSEMHDPIGHDPERGFFRSRNNAGGIEGGISNGEPIVIRAALKPIPTLKNPLPSVHLRTKEPKPAQYERSDVCAVPAGAVVLENAVALELAQAFLEKYGGDSIEEIAERYTV